MKPILALATLVLPRSGVDAFQKAPGNAGPCRGPGGEFDKVNNRFASEIDEDECRAYCAAEASCNGYSHSPASNEGECLLHGPGLAGTCADDAHDLRSACEGAGEVWTGPEDPWKGESWHSTVVAGTTNETSSAYSCYELDDDDHLAQCNGDSCDFTGDERVEADCPDGCAFVAEPEMPPGKPPHPGDIGLPGWEKPLSGACRGGAEMTDKVNHLWAEKDSQTQTQCAEYCVSLPDCIGYHHGPYCSVFGPNIHKTVVDGVTWHVAAHNHTEITGTKENAQYICFMSVPGSDSPGSGGAGGDKPVLDDESSASKLRLGSALLSLGAAVASFL